MEKIVITLKNRVAAKWEASKGEWDDYAYDGKCFVIKKDGIMVGIYNMDAIISVVILEK